MDRRTATESEQLARRNYELTILNEIASALNQEVDLGAALKTALEKVAQLLELRTGWIWLLRGEEAYLAASLNLPPALRDDPQRMEGGCHCLNTFRAGDLSGAANVNVVSCSRLSGLVDGTGGLRYHTSVPLYASHGKKLGVLNVADTEWRELSRVDLRLLYTIGDLVSITIERARLFDRSAQIGAMDERNRLAREIHDTLAQNLTAITLQLETADALLEGGVDRERIWSVVRKALELSREGLVEARRSVLDLRAAPLEGRSLGAAAGELLEAFRQRTGSNVHYSLIGGQQPLPVRIELGLYRILQEALANVERHAQASQVNVELTIRPESIKLKITDDGRGFDPENINKGRYGLTGINERAHLMEGQMDLQSDPGAGTQLRVMVPLDDG